MITDFVHGTSAPGTGDIELRVNTTDQNSANMTVKDIALALKAFARAIESEAIFGGDWGI